MLYEILRGTARLALRRYYADVVVQGRQHIPADAPLLVVANHPNALVDAMLVATAVRRRVFTTGLVSPNFDSWQRSALATLRDLIRRGQELEAALTSTKAEVRKLITSCGRSYGVPRV